MNPQHQQALYEEIVSLVGKDGTPEYDQLSQFNYLHAVLNETLRIYPPIIAPSMRIMIEDGEIDGYIVPKDVCICSTILLTC